MVIAVDFDGTIVENMYPEIGAPKYDVVYALKDFRAAGNKLILWTCRDGIDLERAVNYCEKILGLHFDYINTDTDEALKKYPGRGRKVGADLYIDDKALSPDQFVCLAAAAAIQDLKKEINKRMLIS